VRLDGQEGHTDTVLAFRGESEAEGGALAGEELVGDLDEDAGAIAGFGVAAAGSAMGKIDEDLDAFSDDVVGFVAFNAGDEADTAGIVLVAWVVEALWGGEMGARGWAGDTLGFGHVFSGGKCLSVAGILVSRNVELIFMQYKYA
jgi:hypothetical protein